MDLQCPLVFNFYILQIDPSVTLQNQSMGRDDIRFLNIGLLARFEVENLYTKARAGRRTPTLDDPLHLVAVCTPHKSPRLVGIRVSGITFYLYRNTQSFAR
jgi:hypothetical protein